MTIREAAWLTDGTYKYEEVVRYVRLNYVLLTINNLSFSLINVKFFRHFLVHRMMGEVMSCIKGQVRVSFSFI